ncbi:phosphatase PAP2 family protein [Enterococcus alcedinis]|uniref:Phosphatase PAP2 family protein n=1 Tax=Enterococcus alcedinis TaxID=1274384 RepID=A0A917JGK4_9ENTE|nr:phosphatase PAP2 family protein [Enterococcus alcedinis]MBP2101880.1 undecaprenyl-diphosphatase [Enterococcus alcedinis]GGI65442.1 phosphatase PAP2 family protein [Enterococcus alcedinis]
MKNKLYYQFAGSCFLLILTVLGYFVKSFPKVLQPFDQWVTGLVYNANDTLTPFFLWITQFANPLTIIILFLAILFVLLFGKQYAEAIWLSLSVIGISGVINPLLKLAFGRERPALEHLVSEHSLSFPSGHATASMILYGSLIFLLPLFIENKTLRLGLQILLGLVIFTIGLSRIYLGVHYPTDIIGGYSLALGWLLWSFPIYQEKRFIWRFQSKQN